PRSPYGPLVPSQRWFPADETLRTTAYDKLLPPLVAKIREQVHAWWQKGYAGASATSVSLLRWWFETDHLLENEWQSFRTLQKRDLELTTAPHNYGVPGRYTIAVKVIDIFRERHADAG